MCIPRWKDDWRDTADEEFNKRLAEFQPARLTQADAEGQPRGHPCMTRQPPTSNRQISRMLGVAGELLHPDRTRHAQPTMPAFARGSRG